MLLISYLEVNVYVLLFNLREKNNEIVLKLVEIVILMRISLMGSKLFDWLFVSKIIRNVVNIFLLNVNNGIKIDVFLLIEWKNVMNIISLKDVFECSLRILGFVSVLWDNFCKIVLEILRLILVNIVIIIFGIW